MLVSFYVKYDNLHPVTLNYIPIMRIKDQIHQHTVFDMDRVF